MLKLGAKLLRVAKNIKKGVRLRTKLVMALIAATGRGSQAAGRESQPYFHSEERSDEESACSVLGTRYWVLSSLCKHLHIDMPHGT